MILLKGVVAITDASKRMGWKGGGYLISRVVLKLSGTPYNEECRRYVGADEEHHDGDGDQHLDSIAVSIFVAILANFDKYRI